MDIKIRYRASDGYSQTRKYKTLKGAQRYAQEMVGETPEMGTGYAVSGDGIGTIRVSGTTLKELFPKAAHETGYDDHYDKPQPGDLPPADDHYNYDHYDH